MNLKNIYSYITGIVTLRGNTDNTLIGNNGNRLLVDAIGNREKTFHIFQSSVAIASNKSMLSLYNAGGASVKVRLREVRIINSQTTAITGIVADFQLKRFSTVHSAGTAITPQSSDSADTLDAGITARTGATIAGESAANLRRVQYSSDEWGVGTLDQEGHDHALQATGMPLYSPNSDQKPITLNTNQGIHVKQVTNSTAGTFDLLFVFTEESS